MERKDSLICCTKITKEIIREIKEEEECFTFDEVLNKLIECWETSNKPSTHSN